MSINKRSYLLSVCLAVLASIMLSALWPSLAWADGPVLSEAEGPRADEGLRITIVEAEGDEAPTLADLPLPLQYVASRVIGADQSAYQVEPQGNGFRADRPPRA